MDPQTREELEREIRSRAEAADYDGAATAAVRGYGPEVFRYLLGLHGESTATEVFSLFGEGIWRGLATFDWGCSFRTYAYAVARKASLYHRRSEGRRAAREVPLEWCQALSAIEEQIRSQTLSFFKTARKNRFAEIRDGLPPDDRALLMLRVDQKLAWNDCVLALRDDDQPLSEADIKREAARLRKRFQLMKERLRDIGRSEGLVGDSPAAREE